MNRLKEVFNTLSLKKVSSSVICIVIGIFLGFSLSNSSPVVPIQEDCPNDLTFIKPEQDCQLFKNASEKMSNLQDNLKRQVNSYTQTKRALKISVFVRDLNSQRFAFVNETEQFYMASLLKVPLAIAYLRLAELTPDLLSKTITYTGEPNLYSLQEIQPPEKLIAGTTYTIEDLIYKSLAYSDNTAAELLSQSYVSPDYLQKIIFTLGLRTKKDTDTETIVTARSYAGIFRTLYNASFLSRDYSNKILSILSKSSFASGFTARIPKYTQVAHKFAERSVVDPVTHEITSRQLHDCGIVYKKRNEGAYSFCILTEGTDFKDLTSIIQTLASTIYTGVVE